MENLIEIFNNLILKICYSFTSDKDEIEDLYQAGVIGLLKAKKNYDDNRNVKFSTFAYKYIYGEIYEVFNSNKAFKTNKDTIKLYKLIQKTSDYLSQKNKCHPSTKDISNYLKIDENIIEDNIIKMSSLLSLDNLYNESSTNGLYTQNFNVELDEYLNELSEEEKKVILYKYYEGYTQSEIAKKLNISQVTVSRCESKSLEKMRKKALDINV